LEDDPYRSVSEPYLELNALGEIRFGSVSIFVNAINLTNIRQTRFEPLIRPTPGLGGTRKRRSPISPFLIVQLACIETLSSTVAQL